MPLERKPVESAQEDPGYPTSDQYAGDRRTFLTMLGVTAAAVVGLYSLRESKLFQPGKGTPRSNPQAMPAGGIQPVQPQAAVPGEPSAPPPEPARPHAQIDGDVAAPEPPAHPQAQIRGNVAVPEPVQPVAPVPGGIRAPAPAKPTAQAEGGLRAPEPAPAPVKPEANAKGGVGVIRLPDPKTVAQKPPLPDEDF